MRNGSKPNMGLQHWINPPNDSDSERMETIPLVTDKNLNNKSAYNRSILSRGLEGVMDPRVVPAFPLGPMVPSRTPGSLTRYVFSCPEIPGLVFSSHLK